MTYVETCPACGEPVDYCPGHGEVGDTYGATVLLAHDLGEHATCHPASYCRDEYGEPEEHRHEHRRDLADWWCHDCQTVTDFCQQTNPR